MFIKKDKINCLFNIIDPQLLKLHYRVQHGQHFNYSDYFYYAAHYTIMPIL